MKKQLLVVLIASIFLFSCTKNKEPLSWDTGILAPILTSSMNIDNILIDTLVHLNSDNSISIVYSSKLYNLNIDTVLNLPDTGIRAAFPPSPILFAMPLDTGYSFVNIAKSAQYQLGDVQLKRAILKSEDIVINAVNGFDAKVKVRYEMPNVKLNGVSFNIVDTIPGANGSSPGVFNKTYSLAGYEVDFTASQPAQYNIVQTVIGAVTTETCIANPGDSIVINTRYTNIKADYAYGYFGQDTLSVGPSETTIGLFKKVKGGSLSLEDAKVYFTIENYLGLNAFVNISQMYSKNTTTNTTVNLSASSIINNQLNITRATENPLVSTVVTRTLNSTNSNIKALLNNLPDKMGYQLDVYTNPFGPQFGDNFIYSGNTFNANVDIEIPVSLYANNLWLVDTVDFTLSAGELSEKINNGVVSMYVDNGFPYSAKLQMYLLDEMGTTIDSLYAANSIIQPGIMNSANKVVAKKFTKIDFPLTATKLDNMSKAKRMIISTVLNTASQPQYVKVYSDYSIDVKMVADFDYRVSMGK
ncbi:MAG: hypothetical protein J0M08_13605 [Bacteroidetes bacterium]|nr:hypothetical protein [Bacteroidota bacterium]